MSAPITNAHLRLANQIVASPPSPLVIATLIADSEARAKQSLLVAYDVVCGLRNRLATERDQLRAEVERLKTCGIVEIAASNPSVLDYCKHWEARAERAEAELHALRLVCGTTDADKFSTWVDRANDRAEKAEAELKRYTDAVDAQPWATDEPIRVLLDRITIRLAAAETQLSTNHERAENIIKSREERIDSLGQEVTERRRDAQKSAALVGRLRRALADAISTYDPNRKETLVTAERQEAWIAALQEDAK